MALKRSQENIARSEERKARNANEVVREPNQVDATQLSQPVSRVTVPEPLPTPEATGSQGVVSNVLGSIRSQSENARKLEESNQLLGSFADKSSAFDMQDEQLKKFGVTPEKLARLEDIGLQLSDRNTESKITQSRIQGAAGQTAGQAGREVSQEQREESIRSMGLAAEASVLQGNIETGRSLARDAVTMALADRDFKYQNLIRQNNQLSKQVDDETSQLLMAENRRYTEERENINRVKDAVDSAVSTGAATSSQMAQLTDPNISDVDRMKVAQEVIANSASVDRNLKLAEIGASLSSARLSAKKERLGLCQAGDASMCSEFNIDPNALTEEEIEERVNNHQQSLSLQGDMDRLQGVIDNDAGLQMSAGAIKSPLVSSILNPMGGVLSYPAKKEVKEQFLGDVEYLLNNRIFEKVAEIKAGGYSGAISNVELNAMANASSVLNSLAIKDPDTGTIIGFRGGEENLRKELNYYMDIYTRANDALNTKALQTSQKSDIIKAYDEN